MIKGNLLKKTEMVFYSTNTEDKEYGYDSH